MFIEQEIKIIASSLENFSKIVISLQNAGLEFEEEMEENNYKLIVNHENLTAKLHLFKIRNSKDYDNTTKSEIND